MASNVSSPNTSSYETVGNDFEDFNLQTPVQEPIAGFADINDLHQVIITNASIDIHNLSNSPDLIQDGASTNGTDTVKDGGLLEETSGVQTLGPTEPKSNCVSPASSNGGIYSVSFSFFFFL